MTTQSELKDYPLLSTALAFLAALLVILFLTFVLASSGCGPVVSETSCGRAGYEELTLWGVDRTAYGERSEPTRIEQLTDCGHVIGLEVSVQGQDRLVLWRELPGLPSGRKLAVEADLVPRSGEGRLRAEIAYHEHIIAAAEPPYRGGRVRAQGRIYPMGEERGTARVRFIFAPADGVAEPFVASVARVRIEGGQP